MPWTIERLRLAIVALAVLLLLTIAGAFFYGRWRLRRIAQDLPARLGIQIQQSTQGFVLSKTEQGRPLFTLHAARAVEFKSGGHVSLHDVEIDIYNRQDGKADTIAGSDFEFDPHSEIVESRGEAHIVLHAPETNARTGAASKVANQLIRVTTHGLTFNQKTGVATCSGEVDFEMEASSGQAVGAEYDSKAGQLLLKSQVVLTAAEMQNHPSTLKASRAIYDRTESQVHLWQPRYSSQAESGIAGAATVFLRGNGSAESLDAKDGVRLTSADGMAVRAPTMHVLLNEDNRPQQAHFFGGVQFTADQPPQKTSGNAREAEIDFNAEGRAKIAVFDHDVQFHQQTDAVNGRLQRTLASDHLLLHLLPSKTGNAQLQSADANGNAVFTSQSTVQGHAPQKTTLAAQTLKANFVAGNQMQQINGAGQTRLQMVAANRDIDTSTGDMLQIEFAPSQNPRSQNRDLGHPDLKASSIKFAGKGDNPLATQSIRTAVQTGHVVLQQTAHGKNGDAAGAQISTATAERASYVAANDTLTLTGEPLFRNAQLEMTANRMEVNRTTGKMISTGAVQTTLLSNSSHSGTQSQRSAGGLLDSRQPVHVIAEQATLMHDTGLAIFSGRARLWQGGDSVEAPVIELSQKLQTLTAYSNRPCTQCVISNFLGAPNSSAQPSVFRVLSERLTYSGAERKASFINHVQVISSSGQMSAENAEIFLTPAIPPSAGKHIGNGGEKEKNLSSVRNNVTESSVERIVATRHVRLLQPGRTAIGDRLIYTAADGHFVLTGDEKNPPEVVDADRGTVTGQVLTFASRDQAIMVSGTSGHTTTTKTRVQKQ